MAEFVPAVRNRDGIADAALRATVDPTFEALHDALTIAYYQHWRQGESWPWQGYDVQATPAESKALFDQLHGLIFHHREVALDAADQKRPLAERILDRRRLAADGRTKAANAIDAIDAASAKGLIVTLP